MNTERDIRIIQQIAMGMTVREIAKLHGIHFSRVQQIKKKHQKSIYRKPRLNAKYVDK